MDWTAEARRIWGLDETVPPETTEPAETTQQKAIRLSRDAREGATPGPVSPQAQQPQEQPDALQDTQAQALPDPASTARLKQKLRVMVARKG